MPAEPFSVHLNLDEIAARDIAAALHPTMPPGPDKDHSTGSAAAHHGAGDERQAARERSGRARANRSSGGRGYAFRRS
ncbi:hypothetical protein [Actinoplanes derwentensis]|uniref:Uncharacterized protein n=1 Tax=Actinoplanes derwentensis TaxID=113562 RepID=A0A1H1PXF4_9ACTN|nr:hypothetical protein [Actinoplanes derwentensis]GID82302.1 hypothetical protein Ade03nite_12260 [Actinoplanes derwentensis]SDS15875.1 hypothetical protein SAMN04489716_0144 [Actinoplanes derwentensis]